MSTRSQLLSTSSLTTQSKVASSYPPSHYLLFSLLVLKTFWNYFAYSSIYKLIICFPLLECKLSNNRDITDIIHHHPTEPTTFPSVLTSLQMCGINTGILDISLLTLWSTVLVWATLFGGTLSWWVKERRDSQHKGGPWMKQREYDGEDFWTE